MLGVRPRSPGPGPGPGPAKRLRLEEPAAPEPPAPPLPDPAGPDAAATSVVVLAAGCSVQVTVDGVDLLLEPEPTSVLQVSLQGHTLVLIPEGLLGLGDLQLGTPRADHVVVVEPGFLGACTLEIARREEAAAVDDAGPEFLVTWVDAPASPLESSPSPERRAAGPAGDLVHLLRPFPGSALKPLPPSPPASPRALLPRPPDARRPGCKARRRLF